METLGPVTLIVKAPNQKIEDKTVACNMNWTVRKLKEHLSSVYPEKPSEDHQKLVYYGKLLPDESYLKDVLNRETYDGAHTVHLVCHQFMKSQRTELPTEQRFREQDTSQPQNLPAETPDGLRHRGPTGAPTAEMNQEQFQQYLQQLQNNMNIQTAQYHNMSPQQRLWFQAYYQQMMLFTAQAQQGMHVASPNAQLHAAVHTTQANAGQPQAEQPVAAGQQNDNDVVRMNAQGGVDGDLDGENQDWLDTIYMFVRFGMLLMILYFYSSFGRFTVVVGIGMALYMLQGGFFAVRRRHVNRVNRNENNQQEEVRVDNQQNQPEDQAANQQQVNNDIHQETEPSQSSMPENNQQQSVQPLRVLSTFVLTFFTSLIPQNPDANNN